MHIWNVMICLICMVYHTENDSVTGTHPSWLRRWRRPRSLFCDGNKSHHSVWSTVYNTCVSKCYTAKRVPKGERAVVDEQSDQLNEEDCPDETYQPSSYISNTQCGCSERKSQCNKIGQITASNGSTVEDRTCRCNYDLGFGYNTSPKIKYSCRPKKEDCTCKKVKCAKGCRLSPDYKCVQNASNCSCPLLEPSTYEVQSTGGFINNSLPTEGDNLDTDSRQDYVAVIVCSLVVGFCSVFVGLFAEYKLSIVRYIADKWKCYNKIPQEDTDTKRNANEYQKKSACTTWFDQKNESNKSENEEVVIPLEECDSVPCCKETGKGKYSEIPSDVKATVSLKTTDVQINEPVEAQFLGMDSENFYRTSSNLGEKTDKTLEDECDITVLCVRDDKEYADNYIDHLHDLNKEFQTSIKVKILNLDTLSDTATYLAQSRHIFIYISKNFTIEKLRMELDFSHIKKKYFNDSINIDRIKVVCAADVPIPTDFHGLNVISYYGREKAFEIYKNRMKFYFTVRKF